MNQYIVGQLTGSGFNTDKNGSKKNVLNGFVGQYLISPQSYCAKIFLQRKDSGGFQYQCKNAKNDFLD